MRVRASSCAYLSRDKSSFKISIQLGMMRDESCQTIAHCHPQVKIEMKQNISPNWRRIAMLTMPLLILLLIFPSPARLSASLPQVGADARPKPTPAPKKSTPSRPTTRTQPVKHSTPRPTSQQAAPEIEMVLIPAGTFMMGSPDSEAERSNDEGPQHQVSVQSLYMGKYEVTQARWRAVMGANPSRFKGDNLPVENVSWNDAVEFCRKLSQMTGREYRLPTEAEWECACRADAYNSNGSLTTNDITVGLGETMPFAYGSSLSSNQANFDGNYPYGGAAKGVNRGSQWQWEVFSLMRGGLYDMHGNVWEWCEDWYRDSYNGAPTDGSAWLSRGERKSRILRGGSWDEVPSKLRSAFRGYATPDHRRANYDVGRVVTSARSS
jgi:formylglycine-generating enzyme required for sulfatase activity